MNLMTHIFSQEQYLYTENEIRSIIKNNNSNEIFEFDKTSRKIIQS